MLTVADIEQLFHYSTENKDNDYDKKEKNERRYVGICRRVPEVTHAIYDSKKGILDSIQIVNERYSLILNEGNIASAIRELQAFQKIIASSHIDLSTKATVIKSFDFKEYKKILNTCKYSAGLKSISRLSNMKVLADKYLHGLLTRTCYCDDIKEQVTFFDDLISKYESMSTDNCYVYILRYDLKTIKKRTTRNSTRR